MVTRILVPMDDSAHAGQALEFAVDNFPDADISVLHVVGVPSAMMGEATAIALSDDLDEAAEKRSTPVFDRARAIADERGREIETTVGVGHPVRTIIDRAEEYDTIALGAHGTHHSRSARKFLVGNVAETVSKRAPVPVIIVR